MGCLLGEALAWRDLMQKGWLELRSLLLLLLLGRPKELPRVQLSSWLSMQRRWRTGNLGYQ